MKKISAGVIITDYKYILLGHGTGHSEKNGYDIFKGWVWFNIENHRNAAVRELREESGIILDPDDLIDVGIFKYHPNKDLHLYIYESNDIHKEFPLKNLHCDSMVFMKGFPEIDKYKFCKIEKEMKTYIYKGLYPIVDKILYYRGGH